jgi:Uma2 family endonuclease
MRHTLAEYLSLEENSPIRHEYLEGEIYAMAGGTPDHAALAATVLRLIGSQLPHGCRAFSSDLRVRIESTGLSTYPDAAVICGKTRRSVDDPLAVVNPVLLVEVTSRSTEEYDRSMKLEHYQSLSTLREVLIVSHRDAELTLYSRSSDGIWRSSIARAGDFIDLACIGGKLVVNEVYRDGLEDAGV